MLGEKCEYDWVISSDKLKNDDETTVILEMSV